MDKIDSVLRCLRLMSDGEVAVSDFYSACMERWPEKAGFWRTLSEEELGHSEDIMTMYRMVSSAPHNFRSDKPFTAEALRMFLAGVLKLQRRVRDGHIEEFEALASAVNIERSLIERRFDRLAQTDDPAYNGLIEDMQSKEKEHLLAITRRMAEEQLR